MLRKIYLFVNEIYKGTSARGMVCLQAASISFISFQLGLWNLKKKNTHQ